MEKIILPTIAFCIISVLLFNKNDISQDKQNKVVKDTISQSHHHKHSHVKSKDRINLVKTTDKKKPTNRLSSSEEEKIFKEADIDEVLLSMDVLDSIEPISAIQMEQESFKNVQVGDIIILPTIDGITYKVKISHVELTFSGSKTIIGTFTEEGSLYTSILTEGKDFALISMMTPEGNYEVEMSQGKGLIYATSDIENARIDYSKKDTINHVL